MGLIEIKNYLMQARMTSLSSLCAYFNCESEVLRCMLSHWVRKGRVRMLSQALACKSACFKCDVREVEIYEWVK